MIQIFLDGRIAVPDSNASIKLTSENPYYTKSASYTYEVELPCGIPQNRAIFGDIDRIDTGKDCRTYLCRLVVDNETMLSGTAHVTSVSESAVKIQMLGAESAFNYGNKMEETYVDEMDLGNWFHRTWPDRKLYSFISNAWETVDDVSKLSFASTVIEAKTYNETPEETVYTTTTVEGCQRQFRKLTSGRYPWLMIPVENTNYDHMCNRPSLYETAEGSSVFVQRMLNGRQSLKLFDEGLQYTCIQPFLWKMAEIVAEASGYTLAMQDNALYTDPFLKRLFIVNGNNFIECNKCLPHWTVNEWWTQLEQTFGLVMSIDYEAMSMSLRRRSDYYSNNAPVSFIGRVVDQFTVDVDDDTQSDIAISNVGFSDCNADPYDLLTEYIHGKAVYNDEFRTHEELAEWCQEKGIGWLSENAKGTIFRTADGRCFIFMDDVRQEVDKDGLPALVEPGFREVDQFRPRITNRENTDLDIELKFVPARWVEREVEIYRFSEPKVARGDYTTIKIPMLSVDGSSVVGAAYVGDAEGATSSIDIEALIKGQEEEQESATESQDLVFIAIAPEAASTAHTYAEFREDRFTYAEIPSFQPLTREQINIYATGGVISKRQARFSLSLNHVDGVTNLATATIDGTVSVDTRMRHCIKFLSDSVPDPKSVFVIRNRRFVCEKIETNITPDGIDRLHTGYFFPLEG